MPRTCTICAHNRRTEIDRDLLAGRSLRNVAQRCSVSTTALFRHQKHISATLVKAKEASEIARADSLLDQLRNLTTEAQSLKRKAEQGGDYRTALAAVRELCRLIELMAKLTGELDERSQTNILNVQLDPQTARRVAETYLARHSPPELEGEVR